MNKLCLLALGFAIAAGFVAVNYVFSADLRAVQAGEAKLVCFMQDGERTIAPNKVVGQVDGVWLFDNGHARNCKIVRWGEQ